MKQWGRTFLNAFLSTFPVILIVAILYWTGIGNFDNFTMLVKEGDSYITTSVFNGQGALLFVVGSLLLFVGVALFSIGTENAMSKIGEHVGATMTAKKNLIALVMIVFLLGLLVTVAEPDLGVLARRLEGSVNEYVFIVLVGIGVGVFLVAGVLRILLQKSLKVWLLAFYALIFALACLVDETFIPLTFDSGGVTTGPVTVPFILALGVGIATSRAGKSSNADSFGLTAFCSIGPLIVVLIFGLIVNKQLTTDMPYYTHVESVGSELLESFLESLQNVSIAIVPIIVFFFIYNAAVIHLPKKQILRIIVGLFYTYIGLIIFLTGVEGAFSPIAKSLGQELAKEESKYWLLLLIGGLIGLVVVLCEPAVQVLVKQVEQVSDGQIKKVHMLITLSLGIALAVILALIRIIYKFPITYYVVPGYILALGLTFIVPDIYVGIAFDAGGVASGPMTSAFILPFTLSVGGKVLLPSGIESEWTPELGNQVMTNAFGTVALVAMMPLIVIQILGFKATIDKQRASRLARERVREANDNQVIHFEA